MKGKFLFSMILVAGLMIFNFSAGNVFGQAPQDKVVKKQMVKYTCAMHPEVAQDIPGNCPKCGEKLVEKKDVPAVVVPKEPEPVTPKAQEPVNEKKVLKMPDTTSVKKAPKL